MGLVRFGVFGCKYPISRACLDLGFCDDGMHMQMHFGFWSFCGGVIRVWSFWFFCVGRHSWWVWILAWLDLGCLKLCHKRKMTWDLDVELSVLGWINVVLGFWTGLDLGTWNYEASTSWHWNTNHVCVGLIFRWQSRNLQVIELLILKWFALRFMDFRFGYWIDADLVFWRCCLIWISGMLFWSCAIMCWTIVHMTFWNIRINNISLTRFT